MEAVNLHGTVIQSSWTDTAIEERLLWDRCCIVEMQFSFEDKEKYEKFHKCNDYFQCPYKLFKLAWCYHLTYSSIEGGI